MAEENNEDVAVVKDNKKVKKSKTKTTTSSTSSTKALISNKVLSFAGFVAMALIAISLILQLCFKNADIVNSIQMVGEGIAYIISILLGLNYVTRKKQIGWLIAFIVFTVVIVVFFFLR